MTPPKTKGELRQLIDRLADPEEMARWLEEILNPDDDRAGQRPDEQGRLLDL